MHRLRTPLAITLFFEDCRWYARSVFSLAAIELRSLSLDDCMAVMTMQHRVCARFPASPQGVRGISFFVAMAFIFSACDSNTASQDNSTPNQDEDTNTTGVALDISGYVIFPRSQPVFKTTDVRLLSYEGSGVGFEWILNPAPDWPSEYAQAISEGATSDTLSYALNFTLQDCAENRLMLKFTGQQCDQPAGSACDAADVKRSAPLYVWALADTVHALTLPSSTAEPLIILNVFSKADGHYVRCTSEPQVIDVQLTPQVCDDQQIPWCFAPQ